MKYLSPLLVLFLVGCQSFASPGGSEKIVDITGRDKLKERTIRFLALGDSYTVGQGVVEEERWPEQLAARLQEQGFDTEITIIARTSWTTSNLLSSLSENPPQGSYDFVSLLIGVNDQFRSGKPEDYRIRFRELLEQAISFSGDFPENVIVISIPDWEVTPYAQRLARPPSMYTIDAFNTVNLEEAQAYGVRYVDVTPISRQATKDQSLLAPDGLHPSGAMYALWVDTMLPQILEILR